MRWLPRDLDNLRPRDQGKLTVENNCQQVLQRPCLGLLRSSVAADHSIRKWRNQGVVLSPQRAGWILEYIVVLWGCSGFRRASCWQVVCLMTRKFVGRWSWRKCGFELRRKICDRTEKRVEVTIYSLPSSTRLSEASRAIHSWQKIHRGQ
jgi:hypothetical protein